MDIVPLYDRHGRAVAYFYERWIYLYSGQPVGYLHEESRSVYAFSGRHLGWFTHGWVRDHHGTAVYFTTAAEGGPARPARQARPARGARGARPARGARQARPARPARQSRWSELAEGDRFFNS